MYKFFTISLIMLLSSTLKAQQNGQTAFRLQSFSQVLNNASPFDSVQFRNVGPSIMSGRVVDIEVNPSNTKEFFVAYASGGVWHTANNGLSFMPIFDYEATLTVGDMAMDWKNNVLWVGTGEVNSSRSSYAGTGLYKSEDRGKNWQHMGLPETHHIGKIVLHPTDKNTLWVGALGHLYTPNLERGVFKSTNGGRTWEQVLFVNEKSGCVDLIADANNPQILFASIWTRERKAWNFEGAGNESAIYKSIDGGDHWKKMTSNAKGFPEGTGVGRIGIAMSKKNSQLVYALLDNNFHQDQKKEDVKKIKARDFLSMTESDFNKLSDHDLNDYLKENDYPKKYDAKQIRQDIKEKKYTLKQVGDWRLADADASLFDTPVIGAELYLSRDGGDHWEKKNENQMEGVYFTYGYYFGTISVSDQNENKVWVAGYPILKSSDGGKTFIQKDGDNCHPDYHRIWINPSDEKHIIACNDGGVNISYDEGDHWAKCNTPAVGQFYTVAVDDANPYNVYGGLQDNGTWKGSSQHKENTSWHQEGRYGYDFLSGGDGMQVQVDTRTNKITYTGYQFGNYMRKGEGKPLSIKPEHNIGEKPFRFNWQSPILLSKHNQDIFYYGSNCFHRSMHQGEDLKTLSEDLSSTSLKGNVPYGTLTTISESPLKFGLLYCGTDDGNCWVSQDVGYTWSKISNSFPANLWVSRVTASRHQQGDIYVSLNGYRQDDFTPYLFYSSNYGQSWQAIGKNLPYEPINVIKEDPKNENIIYVGTDNGLYVSLDKGNYFTPWRGGLPRVAVHDIAIQERENEIVLGTHGRSIYIGSLNLIQQFEAVKDKAIYLLPLADKTYNKNVGQKWASYAEPQSVELPITFFLKQDDNCILSIFDEKDRLLVERKVIGHYGWNTYKYNFQLDAGGIKYQKAEMKDDGQYYLSAGTYTVLIESENGQESEVSFILKEND